MLQGIFLLVILIAQILFEVSSCVVLPVVDIRGAEQLSCLWVVWVGRSVRRLGLVNFNSVGNLFIILNRGFRKNNGRCRHLTSWCAHFIRHSERTRFDLLFRHHL